MIKLTRLNGHPIAINPDLIKFIESTPDTMLTLVTAERLIVREPLEIVVAEVAEWRAHVLRTAWPDSSHAVQVTSGHGSTHPVTPHAPGHSTDHDS